MLLQLSRNSLAALSLSLAGTVACSGAPSEDIGESQEEALTGPGQKATDARVPELGTDKTIVRDAKVSIAEGVAHVEATQGPVIEAKFEVGDDGNLSLSVYPATQGLSKDAERNVFKEVSGDPTALPWNTGVETFSDQEHLTRSARDLTLVQLSQIGVADAITRASVSGRQVFWAIPTIRNRRAGFGVYALTTHDKQVYTFVDGEGSDESTTDCPGGLKSIGAGPGADATDDRTPELGSDLAVVKTSKTTMAQALAQSEAKYGPAIEAKFEIGDDGKLSLSIYPVGKGIKVDAERNTFFELAGDPTASTYAPSKTEFKMPDAEHLTRSARDLTLVQTASLTLRQAVNAVNAAAPGGFVYWAIPTIRNTRAGYGVYTLGADGNAHYFFVS